MKLRVAGAQIAVIADIELNAEAIGNAIDFAIEAGADILLTPEGSLSGYMIDFDQARLETSMAELVDKAARANLGLALGTCFKEQDGGVYNQIRFYDKEGQFLGFHSKILKTPDEAERYVNLPLRTFTFQSVTIGGLICNDLWANPECTPDPDPHLTQQLAVLGARVIFHAVNGGRSGDAFMETIRQFHEANLRMRARAGKIWIVTVDNCFPFTLPCSAPSGVVDPNGSWAIKAPMQGEQFFVHDIEIPEEN
ncbi:MAG TPA: carbon-nitrogen hydrolase family protein [Candidatus Lokiarchaeia archaeon]|nr:carbon-nitrogen hydrolase family protein [Candidatus Lokiarchaeia archaeon]